MRCCRVPALFLNLTRFSRNGSFYPSGTNVADYFGYYASQFVVNQSGSIVLVNLHAVVQLGTNICFVNFDCAKRFRLV
jgi:hypothetical protein